MPAEQMVEAAALHHHDDNVIDRSCRTRWQDVCVFRLDGRGSRGSKNKKGGHDTEDAQGEEHQNLFKGCLGCTPLLVRQERYHYLRCMRNNRIQEGQRAGLWWVLSYVPQQSLDATAISPRVLV